MKPTLNYFYLSLLLSFLVTNIHAQDTFSICAIDSITGQVGSAGATCIQSSTTSAIIISDVHPGVGVIHTQASYLAGNQNYGRTLMDSGFIASRIVDSLIANDAQNNPLVRQYGVVDMINGIHSAGYTGSNCMNYKNHITGPGYSIQGNILLGQQILDSMEAKFLNTPGSLACKLMAALQGAKVIGADTRCAPFGISSYSAFLRVANLGDPINNFFLDINVNTYPGSHDPIDTLQMEFDNWGGCCHSYIQSENKKNSIKIFPNPMKDKFIMEFNNSVDAIFIYNSNGTEVNRLNEIMDQKQIVDMSTRSPGLYFIKVLFHDGNIISSNIIVE